MDTKNSITFNGLGSVPPLLGVLFVGLKLTNYIDWSWWWVLSPFWIPFALLLLGCLIILIVKVCK